ncbi:probable ATP-dependent RNA helicase ddx42 isoform X2 [Daktulosphaira vitifoliae]|uniref:probable ATP-dependent RNA helicase ddx42 isoform X2 n=1 Tax=Daktulosphaira vitifoliae TaxID=58002 RepID=UPI0021AA067F|nr:probable ATP-dependent RNA helicase ddx42 isoform X2 [Daktulosphaira vitifoliae]
MSRYKSPLTFKKSSATVENFSQFKVDEVTPTRDSTATVNTPDNLWISDNTAQPQPVSRQWKGRDFSSPRFSSPRLRDSPYHWSPNNRNNSWNSDFNNSDFNSSFEQNNLSPYNSQVNRHHNRNYKRNSYQGNDNKDENYYHPSMIEDPWEKLLDTSKKNSFLNNCLSDCN